MVDRTEQLCRCGFTAGHIDHAVSGLQCSNQLNQVVFRSNLHGTATTNASTLTNYINQWTSSGVSITVLGLILKIDSMCPVRISSLSDPECASVTDMPTTAIVAGVVATVCVIAITFIVVVVVVVVKRRRTSYELRDLNKRYIKRYSSYMYMSSSHCLRFCCSFSLITRRMLGLPTCIVACNVLNI